MNISPILLLSIGSAFAFLYGLIITVGWAITRKNRKIYLKEFGFSEVELFNLNSFTPLGVKGTTLSIENNYFTSGSNVPIDVKHYSCYLVEVPSSLYPKIKKGDLILIDPDSNKIKYAFKFPDLRNYR